MMVFITLLQNLPIRKLINNNVNKLIMFESIIGLFYV